MVACNRGKIMQKCKKMMALIMVFALCFGLSACGGGGSDNNDTVENEDDRCSDGSESDIYDSTDTVQYMASMESAEDNPAKQLGYSSIEEMRVQEHEIIASDDSDNTVAEGYWYPDGNRNSLTYIKIQRDTLYWYDLTGTGRCAGGGSRWYCIQTWQQASVEKRENIDVHRYF